MTQSRASTVTPVILVGVAVLTAVAMLGGLVALFAWVLPGRLTEARPGDCLAEYAGNYRVVDCGDADSQYVLLATPPQPDDCATVPGSSLAVLVGGRAYCLGMVGADPARSVTAIVPGDCVTDAENPQRVACGEGSLVVLAVLVDVDKGLADEQVFRLCADHGAPAAEWIYAWGMATDGTEPTTWDRVLCLGRPD